MVLLNSKGKLVMKNMPNLEIWDPKKQRLAHGEIIFDFLGPGNRLFAKEYGLVSQSSTGALPCRPRFDKVFFRSLTNRTGTATLCRYIHKQVGQVS